MELIAILSLLLAIAALPGVWNLLQKQFDQWRASRAGTFFTEQMVSEMNPVEKYSKDLLYFFPGGWARALRLWGAQGQNARASEVIVEYEHTLLEHPVEFVEQARAEIERRRAQSLSRGAKFFNGPNTRLIAWSANPAEDRSVARERDTVKLILGPVGWEDYTGLNDAFRIENDQSSVLPMFRHYVGLDALVHDRSVSSSRLSNILDTATTLITRDGFAGFQLRSGKVSASDGRITSAIAENINRWMDDADPCDPQNLTNANWSRQKGPAPDNSYKPSKVPHPFAAVLRGIASEISPRVLERIHLDCVRLTGISFDLEVMHPDALFVVFVDATRAEVEADRALSPGDEHDEGRLRFVPATFKSDETLQVLRQKEWTGAGLASLLRSIEVIDAACKDGGRPFEEVFANFVRKPDGTA